MPDERTGLRLDDDDDPIVADMPDHHRRVTFIDVDDVAALVAERDDLSERCERLRWAVRLGGELEGALLEAPDDGDRIGSRLLAFSAAYVACEDQGDLSPPEGETGVS